MSIVNIQIKSIEKVKNDINVGQLPTDSCVFGLKFNKKEGLLDIQWTFSFNISSSKYIIHKSKTIFNTENLSLDRLNPAEKERIDLFTQLGQISMAHSRTFFVLENPDLDYIPLILWNHQLSAQMIQKINLMSN